MEEDGKMANYHVEQMNQPLSRPISFTILGPAEHTYIDSYVISHSRYYRKHLQDPSSKCCQIFWISTGHQSYLNCKLPVTGISKLVRGRVGGFQLTLDIRKSQICLLHTWAVLAATLAGLNDHMVLSQLARPL